jgi:hypothetical protein
MSVEAAWQIQNTSTTKQYFDWVKERSEHDYRIISQTESDLIMGKTIPGDSYTLEFRSSASGSKIDVHFLAMGD